MAKSEAGKNDQADEEIRDADFSLLDVPDGEGGENSEGLDTGVPAGDTSTDDTAGDKLANVRSELSETKDKYLRALAEFENYKKRVLKERSELLKYQGENIVFDLLEVVDNLERALQHVEADPEKLKEGLEMIYRRFLDVLKKWDIRGESSVGKAFDPNTEQAISSVPMKDATESIVIEELKKPYFYKDKLLRPGQVVVGVPAESSQESGDGSTEEKEEFDA